MNTFTQYIECDAGLLQINATDIGVSAIRFVNQENRETQQNSHTQAAASQLQQYFSGHLTRFNLSLSPQGTDFQKQVWQALLKIGYGHTASYSDIAKAIGNPQAVRAVGAANGKNPISVVVPCHRIIGKNGTLTGYAGGLERKRFLLALEKSGDLFSAR